MENLIDVFEKEGSNIAKAPWSFARIAAACLTAGFAAGYFVGQWAYPLQHPTHAAPPISAAAPQPAPATPPVIGGANYHPPLRAREHDERVKQSHNSVGSVSSQGQTGGVTAGVIGTVTQ